MVDDVTEIVFDQKEKFKIIELYFEEKLICLVSTLNWQWIEKSWSCQVLVNAQKNLGADYGILRLFKRFATTIDDTCIQLLKMFF
jgi:hypothetical protein